MTLPQVHFSGAAASFTAAPALEGGDGRRHRPARLFVAGEYPDKGVTVSETDLDQIIARFNEAVGAGQSVPVKTEHLDTPLDPLGEVVGLYRQGPELFGMLCFSAGVDEHLRARGVDDVSISLFRLGEEAGGGFALKECSLVFAGRVPGARLLDPEALLARFRAEGRLTPAMEDSARKLLSVSTPIVFRDGSDASGFLDVADETAALIAALPPIQPRGRGSVVPAVGFGTAAGRRASVSPEVTRMAQGLGLAPERLQNARTAQAETEKETVRV